MKLDIKLSEQISKSFSFFFEIENFFSHLKIIQTTIFLVQIYTMQSRSDFPQKEILYF